MKTNLLDFWNRIAGYFLLFAALAFLALLTGCSAPLTSERDVLRVWGTPSSVILDSGWHIDHYVSSDKTTNDFGIRDGRVFFHNNF